MRYSLENFTAVFTLLGVILYTLNYVIIRVLSAYELADCEETGNFAIRKIGRLKI